MGITFDITPMGPHETPEDAIARAYSGGTRISWEEDDEGWVANEEPTAPSAPEWHPAKGWADPVIERLLARYPYRREDTGACTYLWDNDVLWQVEFCGDFVTLRRRSRASNKPPAPTDAEILQSFAGVPAVVHLNGDEWWSILEEAAADQEFRLLD